MIRILILLAVAAQATTLARPLAGLVRYLRSRDAFASELAAIRAAIAEAGA